MRIFTLAIDDSGHISYTDNIPIAEVITILLTLAYDESYKRGKADAIKEEQRGKESGTTSTESCKTSLSTSGKDESPRTGEEICSSGESSEGGRSN